ncbi:hypothetical protein D3C78_1241990 [compost metagenome]
MGQLGDQGQLRRIGQQAIEIQFGTVPGAASGRLLRQAGEQGLACGVVGHDQADAQRDALVQLHLAGLQHRQCLAHSWRRAEKHLEPAALARAGGSAGIAHRKLPRAVMKGAQGRHRGVPWDS